MLQNMTFILLVELNFSSIVYEIYEDDGQFCFNLTLAKPAVFDITVEVVEEDVTATSELLICICVCVHAV